MAEERLRHEAARAFGWVAAAKGFERVVGVLRIVVLARVLAPDDFGAFGIAVLALGTMERLTRPGLAIALVQRAGDVRPYLNAVWTAFVVRSWVIAGVLYASRGLVADFFEVPEAEPIIAGVALATGIGGMTSVSLHLLQRELKLERRFLALAASSVADFLITIPLAFILKDAMALVYGMVARNVVMVVGSFLVHEYKPRPTLDWRPLKDLKDFAVHGAVHTWLWFLVEQGDDAFVGKVLGESALGVYLLTYRVASILTQEVARTLAEVTVPVFSRVQDDAKQLARGMSEAIGGTAGLIVPVATLLAITAEPFIHFFLGPQWLEGVPAFRILLAFGLLRSASQVMEAGLTARGDVAYQSRVLLIQLAAAIAAIVPLGLRYGLPGVAAGVALSQVVSLLVSLNRMATMLECPRRTLLLAARGPVLASAVAGALTAGAVYGLTSIDAPSGVVVTAAALVFGPIYVWVVLPKLRADAPTVLELTLDRVRRK